MAAIASVSEIAESIRASAPWRDSAAAARVTALAAIPTVANKTNAANGQNMMADAVRTESHVTKWPK